MTDPHKPHIPPPGTTYPLPGQPVGPPPQGARPPGPPPPPAAPRPYAPRPQAQPEGEEERPRVVIRDRRRIDPDSGAVRPPAPGQPAPPAQPAVDPAAAVAAAEAAAEVSRLAMETELLSGELTERTNDLQRVTAEYANYRRRTDRDKIAAAESAQDQLLISLIPVLDDLDRAREHGDLTGGFKAVADTLEATLGKTGLEVFGAAGDEFDPAMHEAVMLTTSAEVSGPTCTAVMRKGYRRGERVLRPAMVAVAEPESPPAPQPVKESTGDGAAQPSSGPDFMMGTPIADALAAELSEVDPSTVDDNGNERPGDK